MEVSAEALKKLKPQSKNAAQLGGGPGTGRERFSISGRWTKHVWNTIRNSATSLTNQYTIMNSKHYFISEQSVQDVM